MNIYEFKQQYPEYAEVPDQDLAKKLHAKYYSDVPYKTFADKFGVRSGFGRLGEMMTGSDRETDEMKSIDEIGSAPEMSAMNMDAFKASLGMSFSLGSDESAEKAMSHIGGKLRKDSKGNTIVDLPSGSYALNKPGFSTQDLMQIVSTVGSYAVGGGAAGVGKTVLGTATRQGAGAAATNATIQKLRGEEDIDGKEMALAGGLGAGAEFILPSLKALTQVIKKRPKPTASVKPDIYDDVVEAGTRHDVPVKASDFSPRTEKLEQALHQVPFAGGAKFDELRLDKASQAARNFTDSAKVTDDVGRAAQDSAAGRLSRFKQLEGARYNKVDKILDQQGDLPLTSFQKALGETLKTAEGRNTPVGDKIAKELDQWSNSAAPRTFSSARELRSDLLSRARDMEKAADSQVSSQAAVAMKQLAKAVDDDLSQFAARSPEAASLWRTANQEWKEGMGIYKGGPQSTKVVKKALDTGEVSKIPRMIMTSPSKEKTLEMYNALGSKGRKAVYQGLIDDAYKLALDDNTGNLALGRYATNLRKVYDNAGPFVQGQTKKELDGFAKLMKVAAKSAEAVRNPKTGFANMATGIGSAQGVGVATGNIPLVVISTLAAKSANKHIQSVAFRRFMFEASKTEVGTPAWDKLLVEVGKAMKAKPLAFGITQAEMQDILKMVGAVPEK